MYNVHYVMHITSQRPSVKVEEVWVETR